MSEDADADTESTNAFAGTSSPPPFRKSIVRRNPIPRSPDHIRRQSSSFDAGTGGTASATPVTAIADAVAGVDGCNYSSSGNGENDSLQAISSLSLAYTFDDEAEEYGLDYSGRVGCSASLECV